MLIQVPCVSTHHPPWHSSWSLDRNRWGCPCLSSVPSNGGEVKWISSTKKVGLMGFPAMEVPPNGWFTRENPIKMDDLGIPPSGLETPIWLNENDHTGKSTNARVILAIQVAWTKLRIQHGVYCFCDINHRKQNNHLLKAQISCLQIMMWMSLKMGYTPNSQD